VTPTVIRRYPWIRALSDGRYTVHAGGSAETFAWRRFTMVELNAGRFQLAA
jgi:hypothetical protein